MLFEIHIHQVTKRPKAPTKKKTILVSEKDRQLPTKGLHPSCPLLLLWPLLLFSFLVIHVIVVNFVVDVALRI